MRIIIEVDELADRLLTRKVAKLVHGLSDDTKLRSYVPLKKLEQKMNEMLKEID